MQSPFTNIPPVVKNLLIINIICFLPFILLDGIKYENLVIGHFGVFYFDSPFFKPWQIITYMFLHGSLGHIFFNMFALFSFGPIVEYSLGSKKFFNLYFICGIGAIAFQMLIQAIEVYYYTGFFTISANTQITDPLIIAKLQDIYTTPVVGASGAVVGLLMAFRLLFPEMELMIIFIPVPVKAKYMIPAYIVLEVFLGVTQFRGDNVAHFAHLGGALIGFIMVKIWQRQSTNNFS